MPESLIRAALISTDAVFRDTVNDVVLGPDSGLTLALELPVSFDRVGEEELKALRRCDPELMFLDLQDEPELGVKFAQFVTTSLPNCRFLAAGPSISPELLLEAMRAGVADFLAKPVSSDQLRSAILRLGSRLGRGAGESPRKPGVVYAFASAKGGSGSTTAVTNLAISLHQLTGKRVLLVDLELELGEVALFLGAQPRFNFVDLVQNFHRMDAGLLASYIERHSSGVHLLSAPYHPDRAEAISADQVRRIVHFLRQHYDYVLVDTSKSLSPATLAVFEQSDLVFVVTGTDLPSIRNIQRGLPLIRRALVGGEQQIRLIVNRYHGRETISLQDIERTIGIKVYATLANDYEAVISAVNSGTPLVHNGSSKYAKDLRALGSQIAGLRNGTGRGFNPFRSIMQRVHRSGGQNGKEVKGNE
jgi:pilus assembly protein CpaE